MQATTPDSGLAGVRWRRGANQSTSAVGAALRDSVSTMAAGRQTPAPQQLRTHAMYGQGIAASN
eukprot:6966010-Alexandrium_andersonii.AAC.1